MARVTVEDCLDHVENRFDLVLKAAKRARNLELGAADPLVPKDNDKPTVIALREIAQGFNVIDTPDSVESDVDIAAQMLGAPGPAIIDSTETAREAVFGEVTAAAPVEVEDVFITPDAASNSAIESGEVTSSQHDQEADQLDADKISDVFQAHIKSEKDS